MKLFSISSITALLFLCLSFTVKKEITIDVTVENCAAVKALMMMEFDGFTFKPIHSTSIEEGKAIFTLPETRPRVYYIGTATNNMIPIILGSEDGVLIKARCDDFKKAKVSNSPLNKNYGTLKQELQVFKNSANSMQRQLLKANGNQQVEERALLGLSKIDEQRLSLLDSLKRTQPYLSKVAELNTYLSYNWYGEGFDNELNYFANMYFNYANWDDVDYNYNPWVYESTKAYAQTLSSINIPAEDHKNVIANVLSKINKENRTYKLAMGGMIAGMEAKKHKNFNVFAQQFIEEFKDKDPETVAALQKKIKKTSQTMEGGEAPDFTQDTPEGEPLALSSLRGKVILVDFWASWCGPCRRENPNVVNVYNAYKDKGFDVLSVSLDSDKGRWLSAIEKDKLTWKHVSDLKGWGNEAAKMYGVSSIPATFLLDKEGKIIGRNLRGPALEAKLKEVFGE